MVCDPCANALHADCENIQHDWNERGTWCDCQHRESAIHTNSVVNRNQSTVFDAIAKGFEIPRWMLGDGPTEATQEKEGTSSGG